MDKKILWEKWKDPFVIDSADIELENKEGYKDSYQEMEELIKNGNDKKYTGPVIVGPMGVIPLTENNIPSKIYNFWMGHTNFVINSVVKNKIERVPGVEALDVFTQYRFRIAVGKAFTEDDDAGANVLRAITKVLCDNKQEEVGGHIKNAAVQMLSNHLKSKYQHWIIYKLPNGTLDSHGSNSKEELVKDIESHPEQKLVATSWE